MYNKPMPAPSQKLWFQTSIRVIEELQRSLNSQIQNGTNGLNYRLEQILNQVERLFVGSCCGIFPFDARRNLFDPSQAITHLMDVSNFPEMLSREAALRKQLTISTDLPPSMFFSEGSVMIGSPLLTGDELLGVLIIDLHSRMSVSDDHKIIIKIISQLVCTELIAEEKQKLLRTNLDRKNEELIQLRNASLMISSRLELKETLDAILKMAMQVTCARYGIFRLTDQTGKNLITRAFAGESLSSPITKSLDIGGKTIMGWVAQQREPVCISDLRQQPWSEMYYPLDAMLEMRSELAVPLIGASGRLEGVLNLESPEVDGFNEQDSHLLQSLATQVVIAIQEAKLLDTLREISQVLLENPTLTVLDQIVRTVNELINSSTCSIWLIQADEIRLQAWAGNEKPPDQLPLFDSLPGRSAINRTTENGMATGDDLYPGHTESSIYQVIPLLSAEDKTAVGSMLVTYSQLQSEKREISDWDRKVMQSLAQYASLAIQNAKRQEELQAMQEKQAITETFAMVGDVTANVLHQLNNKLGTIPARIQGIRFKRDEYLLTDEYVRKNLEEIENSANEAMESVRLNLANLRPIELTAVSVSDCVESAIREIPLPTGIDVRVTNLSQLPPVRSGTRSLTLIFENLFTNAIEELGSGGRIEISGKRIGNQVQLYIRDNGPGIPEQEQAKIFETNYSQRKGSSANRLGFGLWWVRTLLLRQGGEIRVESDGKKGTTFIISLPIYQESTY